jgi:hypothetical protein
VIAQHKPALQRLFVRFTLAGDPGNRQWLSQHKFQKLVRACEMLDGRLTYPDALVIFARVTRAGACPVRPCSYAGCNSPRGFVCRTGR